VVSGSDEDEVRYFSSIIGRILLHP
jgi:hypothetical protein